jgi:hypothetical protein
MTCQRISARAIIRGSKEGKQLIARPKRHWESQRNSDLHDPSVAFDRADDSFERGDGGENLRRRDRIRCAAGGCVGKGFEVDAD